MQEFWPAPCKYVVSRCSTPPAVDGWLRSPAWKTARWVDRFIAMDTWAPAKPVRAALLHDGSNLYLAAVLEEPKLAELRADGSPVDADDTVQVCVDPGVPGIEYFTISVNAAGAVSGTRHVIDNPGWGTPHAIAVEAITAAVRLTGTGWQVEVKIPFSAFDGAAAPAADREWRGLVRRSDVANYSWSFWALEDPTTYNYEDPKLFPALQFGAPAPEASAIPERPALAWPSGPSRFAMSGFMYDTSRGSIIYTPDYWKKRFPFFQSLGLNAIVMYFENHLRYESHPAFAPEGSWTLDDLVSLQEAAAGHGIDVIPAQTSLGHCPGILNHPRYKEYAEEGSDGYQFCVAHPGSRKVLTEIFDELARRSRSPYVSINADESAYLGLCPRCQAAFPGWSRGRIFTHHIMPIYETIRARGKRMMMWDDMLWTYPDALEKFPKDVVLLDWHYSLHRRYPSIDRWRAMGFDVVGCPGMYTVENEVWIADHAAEKNALGIINTHWEDHSLPLGSRWQHYLITGWASKASAPASFPDWFVAAERRLLGNGDGSIGRSLAAEWNLSRSARAGTSPLGLKVAEQVVEAVSARLAAGVESADGREWLEEFLYARRLERLRRRAARWADDSRPDRPAADSLRAELDALRKEGVAWWDRHACVPSQKPFFGERFDAIAKLIGDTPGA